MMPCSRARRTRSATGRINAVGEVRWLTARTRVRGVTCCQIASTMSRAERTGTDKGARMYRVPRRSQTNCQVKSIAPYSWSVASTSSPGSRGSDRATMFSPVVELVTYARSSGSAPTYAASASRASRISVLNRRPAWRNSTGCRAGSRRSSRRHGAGDEDQDPPGEVGPVCRVEDVGPVGAAGVDVQRLPPARGGVHGAHRRRDAVAFGGNPQGRHRQTGQLALADVQAAEAHRAADHDQRIRATRRRGFDRRGAAHARPHEHDAARALAAQVHRGRAHIEVDLVYPPRRSLAHATTIPAQLT